MRAKLALLATLALTAPAAAQGPAILGPQAARCAGGGPALLVRLSGLKNRAGTVRIRLFGGSPDTWFEGDHALVRLQIPTPGVDPAPVCVPVPAPGVYAVDVRHDANGNDKSDLSDGGGTSGNPRLSLWSILTRRKPAPATVQIVADRGVRVVPITMMYVQGGRLVAGNAGMTATTAATR